MSSTIRCSQCHQVGHNSRNRLCPINVQRTQPVVMPQVEAPVVVTPHANEPTTPPPPQETPQVPPPVHTPTPTHPVETPAQEHPRIRRMKSLYRMARTEIESLRQTIRIHQGFGMRGVATHHILVMISIVRLVCNRCNAIVELDVDHTFLIDDGILYVDVLVDNILAQVAALNAIIYAVERSIRVVVTYDDVVTMEVVPYDYIQPMSARQMMPIGFYSYTNAGTYFKEIALVQDLAVADNAPLCECPMCFDEFDAKSVIVTNCKHSFCVTCVKGYSTAIKDTTKRPNCPMCRTDITEFKMSKVDIYEDIRSHIVSL